LSTGPKATPTASSGTCGLTEWTFLLGAKVALLTV
jgi:hypothetical protein